MRVGIVGAGFVGLTTAFRLAKRGITVDVYEASSAVGGLASGFRKAEWDWPLERFYHHIFTNDKAIISLAQDVGWPPIYFRPSTTLYFNGKNFPFDSPLSLLRFPHLSQLEKLRMGITLAALKSFPIWKPLEGVTAEYFLQKTMGSGYDAIWKPLLGGKFGPFADQINAAWFWARIQKRTPRLGYFKKGFQGLADRVSSEIVKYNGQVHLETPVANISTGKNSIMLEVNNKKEKFDQVVVTTPTSVFLNLIPELPAKFKRRLVKQKTLGALVVVLALKKPVFKDAYWVNIIDRGLPFLVVVEHTNMIENKYYAGLNILYLGAYLSTSHQYFSLSDSLLVKMAARQLKAMSQDFSREDIIQAKVFKARDAQPVVPINYSLIVPPIETGISNLYLGNMSMVYPWDRGTNYAVELGERIVSSIL